VSNERVNEHDDALKINQD